MRLKIIREVCLLMIAVCCATGWYLQYRFDQQLSVEADAKATTDARQITALQATIARLNVKADIAKHVATEEVHELRKQMFEMQTAFRRKPIGNFIMHFYPRDNSID